MKLPLQFIPLSQMGRFYFIEVECIFEKQLADSAKKSVDV